MGIAHGTDQVTRHVRRPSRRHRSRCRPHRRKPCGPSEDRHPHVDPDALDRAPDWRNSSSCFDASSRSRTRSRSPAAMPRSPDVLFRIRGCRCRNIRRAAVGVVHLPCGSRRSATVDEDEPVAAHSVRRSETIVRRRRRARARPLVHRRTEVVGATVELGQREAFDAHRSVSEPFSATQSSTVSPSYDVEARAVDQHPPHDPSCCSWTTYEAVRAPRS